MQIARDYTRYGTESTYLFPFAGTCTAPVICGELDDKRHASNIVRFVAALIANYRLESLLLCYRQLNAQFPLPKYVHLKRVRSQDDSKCAIEKGLICSLPSGPPIWSSG